MPKRTCWSWRVGSRGARVVVRERTYGGNIRIGAYDPTIGGTAWRSLGFKVRDADGRLIKEAETQAKKAATELSTALIRGASPRDHDVTVGELVRLFEQDGLPSLRGRHRAEMKRELRLIRRVLGPHTKAENLGAPEWNYLKRQRETGAVDGNGCRVSDPDKRRPVGPRTVQKALKALRQVCRFGLETRRNGKPLLAFDPTAGFKLPKNPNPLQPVYTDANYRALLKASREHTMRVGGCYVPSYLPTLLVLCYETGRRIGAVVALRWEDWLPDEGTYGTVRWRAESDKLGRKSKTPVTPEVRDAIEAHRQQYPGFGTLIFPAPAGGEGHVDVPLAVRWFRKAEEAARIEHEPRSGYHSLRRAFATKRKGMAIQDVQGLGGWQGRQVLEDLYQKADLDGMERVLLEGQKVELRVVS